MARIDGGALAFCVLHDLLGAAALLAAHPLHAAYALFFHRGLLALAAFFCPLLLSTALLLVVLLTAAPYVAPGWAGARCLGSTCGVAVAALCAGLRPDGGLGLLGQLCSFVLGPAGVGEIVFVGEVCDVGGGSCFLSEEKSLLYAYATQEELEVEPPLQSLSGEEICFLGNGEFYEGEDVFSFKDEIQEKNVVCEDLRKAPESLSSSSSELCCPGETFMPVPEMEEQEKSINNVSLPERKGFSSDDVVEERRLECDPVPLSAMEAKTPERVRKPRSSISQRIRQWESGNLKLVRGEIEDNPVEICFEKESLKDVKEEAMQLETESCDQKQSEDDHLPREESDRKELPEPELVDVKEELVQSKVAEECIIGLQAEEIASIIDEPEEDPPQEQGSEDVEAEEDVQQPASELPEEQEQEDADGGESPLRTTSIARRVHTRTSSENLAGSAGEGSPTKGKEWKRTLACKLYEERIQHKLCRDPAVAGACADDMDMLWEAYETGDGSSSAVAVAVAGDTKLKGGGSKAREESVDEEEEDDDEEDEGPVRQLCCLQALKFSTRKMNLGGGKPSLSKISRVLKRMTALSRVGSRRK